MRMQHWTTKIWTSALLLAALAGTIMPARAHSYYDQGDDPAPEPSGGLQDELLKAVKFDQKLDSQVPMDATFRDEQGKPVVLKSFFNGKPVILVTVFYHCTMLCSEVLKETVRATHALPFTPGKEYNVVAISIDPRETPKIASDEKAEQLKGLAPAVAKNGWHFLTGTDKQIHRVTDSIGFHFAYDKKTDQFAHPNGIVVLTPHGKVTRYFYGVSFKDRDLKFGLMEAAGDRIGSPVDQLLLTCFHYDPVSGSYDVVVMKIVRLGGFVTMVLLIGGVALALRREKKGAGDV